jgi:GT2 family glycosyltransferase
LPSIETPERTTRIHAGDGPRLPAGAGWYLLEAAPPRTPGDSPVEVILENASGGATSAWIPTVSRGGRACAPLVLALPPGTVRLRLRDEGGGELAANEVLALRKLTPMQAARRMLSGFQGPSGRRDWPATLQALVAALPMIVAGRIARAGNLIARRYADRMRRLAGRGAGRAALEYCRVRLHWWQWPGRRGALAPAAMLRACAGDPGHREWEATGEDPQFRLLPPNGADRIPAGWYALRARFDLRSGRIMAPCLYIDYGDDAPTVAMVPLPPPTPDGRLHALVLVKHDAVAVRFDPSTRRARFVLDEFRFDRMTRAGALRAMLGAIARSGGSSRARACADFLRDALRSGISAAAATLFERYEAELRTGTVSYDTWVRMYDTFSKAELAALRERAERHAGGPLISVLVPVYDTPERWLRRCLDSVLAQAYRNWELCIADDASPSPHVRDVLHEYARRDQRIRVVHRERNGHISAASNSALAMARGDYVALLDHDDELRPHALLEVVEAIAAVPDAGLLYSDEDKIDGDGRRFQPYFKPDWNPDLLLSQNYVCHFTVIRADLARDAGGFREGYEGSQDHDLILRCSERLAPARILHIPKVLYHWRAIAGSTALERGAKDYAADAGVRAVADHLQRTGAAATVEQLPHGHYRVRWGLPAPVPKVSVIIPTRDKVELLRGCVESLLGRTRYPDFEIVIVDNQSVDLDAVAYLDALSRRDRVRVLRYDAPFNYSAMNNLAVAACDGGLVALLNNDIEVIDRDWLAEMAGHALRPGIGAVGAMLYYPNDTIQHAGVILGLGGVANHAYMRQPRGHPGHGARALVAQNLSAVTAACMVVRRSLYHEVGGLDERLQVAFNDIDFCLKLREKGYRNLWTPFAQLYHHESASRGSEDSIEKIARFRSEVALMEARWGDGLLTDPAYNPNLSLGSVDSEMASPPRAARPMGAAGAGHNPAWDTPDRSCVADGEGEGQDNG